MLNLNDASNVRPDAFIFFCACRKSCLLSLGPSPGVVLSIRVSPAKSDPSSDSAGDGPLADLLVADLIRGSGGLPRPERGGDADCGLLRSAPGRRPRCIAACSVGARKASPNLEPAKRELRQFLYSSRARPPMRTLCTGHWKELKRDGFCSAEASADTSTACPVSPSATRPMRIGKTSRGEHRPAMLQILRLTSNRSLN